MSTGDAECSGMRKIIVGNADYGQVYAAIANAKGAREGSGGKICDEDDSKTLQSKAAGRII